MIWGKREEVSGGGAAAAAAAGAGGARLPRIRIAAVRLRGAPPSFVGK